MIATQYHEKMLGDANWYMDFVQCQVGATEYDTATPTYKGLKNEFCSTNNVEYDVGFALMISIVVWVGAKKKTC